jgi:hypothetical protein
MKTHRYLGKKMSAREVMEAADRTLSLLSLEDLAWLAHEAEHYSDDVSMGQIATATENQREFAETYRRIWPEHAKVRSYSVHGGVP